MPGTNGQRYKLRSRSYQAKLSRKDNFDKKYAKAKENQTSKEVNASTEPEAKPEKKRRFRKPQES